MKTLKQFKGLVLIAILFNISILQAQEINQTNTIPSVEEILKDLEPKLPANGRAFNGTTTYDGLQSGTTGTFSSYFGYLAGQSSTSGFSTFIGAFSGRNTTGSFNTLIGGLAGRNFTTGQWNTVLGVNAGSSNTTGSHNVFLGASAGRFETGSNKLYIDNSSTATPLIYGDFASNKLAINTNQTPSNVGGADISAYSLYVKGGLLTEEVRVRTGWADYVFEENYDLLPLEEVVQHIDEKGYLPNMPSAKQVEKQGLELGDITRLQQEKIEELTLYLIALKKEVEQLKLQIKQPNTQGSK